MHKRMKKMSPHQELHIRSVGKWTTKSKSEEGIARLVATEPNVSTLRK